LLPDYMHTPIIAVLQTVSWDELDDEGRVRDMRVRHTVRRGSPPAVGERPGPPLVVGELKFDVIVAEECNNDFGVYSKARVKELVFFDSAAPSLDRGTKP